MSQWIKKWDNPQKILLLVLSTLFLYYALVPVLAIIRLHKIEGIVYIYKGVTLGCLALTCYLIIRHFKEVKWNSLSVLLVIMLIQGTLIGLNNQNPLSFIVSHTFNGVLALVFCLAFNNFAPERERFFAITKIAMLSITLVALGAMIYFLCFMLNGNFYYGMSVAALMLPLGYCLIQRQWALSLAIIVLITLSGKRGVMIAALIETGIYLSAIYYEEFKRYRKKALIIFVSSLPIAFIFMALFELHPLIAKWNIINPLSSNFNLERGSGGRWTEIMRSYEAFQTSGANWIWGAGHGFHYDWWSKTGLWNYDFVRHYMHLSPLNYVFRYGLITASLFFLLLIKILHSSYQGLKNQSLPKLEAIFFLFVVGRLAQGFTSYTWGTDPLLWIAIGYLSIWCAPLAICAPLKNIFSEKLALLKPN